MIKGLKEELKVSESRYEACQARFKALQTQATKDKNWLQDKVTELRFSAYDAQEKSKEREDKCASLLRRCGSLEADLRYCRDLVEQQKSLLEKKEEELLQLKSAVS